MCGVFAAFSIGGEVRVSSDLKQFVCSSLYTRGPDNQTIVEVDDRCLLGHTRLAIIDLNDGSNQPVSDENKNVSVVFNGELYNYKELRLLVSDYKFKTQGDAEVIVALYKRFGLDFVVHARGMFSIIIYDKKKNELFAIRDRFGIKPIYYIVNRGVAYFSSNIDVLRSILFDGGFDKYSLYKYFSVGQLYNDSRTFFENIRQVEPSTIMHIKNRLIKKYKYWGVDDLKKESCAYQSYDECVEYVDSQLTESMEYHNVSDVEVAVNLSSGLDSNYIRMFMGDRCSKPTKCFSFCFDNNEYNECLLFNKFDDKKYDIYQTKISSEDILACLHDVIRASEGPVGGMGMIAFWLNMKDVHDHGIRVVLNGQGADELFAGYKYYLDAYAGNKNYKSMRASDGSELSGADYLNMDYFRDLELDLENDEYFDSPLKNERYLDLSLRKMPKLLHWQDKLSMDHSVEVRVPFLDHVLFENLFNIKDSYLIKGSLTKNIFRDVSSRYIKNDLDQYFVERSKKYMPTPQREWIKNEFKEFILELISESLLHKMGMVDKYKVEQAYKNYINANGNNSYFIWKFINIEMMAQTFMRS